MSDFLIRPHHMLCLQFFEGKGYSPEFVDNMLDLKEKLDNENPVVKIVTGADSICRKCPNFIDGKCKNEDDILKHDKRVYAQAAGIEQEVRWNDICKVIYDEIIHKEKVKHVCVQCKWSDICFNKAVRLSQSYSNKKHALSVESITK